MNVIYRTTLQNGSGQMIVTLYYTLSVYPSVHKQLIRTIFKAHIVDVCQL